ncbi:MAG TPA: phosphotransferase, partial [Thermoanaerobaculia bacterium]|nr:phosphotransferase [Thermoanaerobaculia bacterium]
DAARWLGDFHAATHRGGDVTASHGDFWAHNVLSDPKSGRVGVIDWENFSESSSRFVDLFQYPLTYGIGFPWRRYRALDAESAFAKTFFEENRVSAAVRAYFVSYCTRTGVAASRLRAAFREYLAGPHTLPGLRPLPWPRFLAQFDAARESVFS